MPISAFDLTQRAPRSARVRLGGYVILPRMIDKCRATLNGKNGEYHFACPLDQQFLTFAGVDPEQFKAQAAAGKSDSELLEWIDANAKSKRSPVEIAAWTCLAENRVPVDMETRAYFQDIQSKAAPQRKDIATWFDLLDVDDYATYGGKP